MRGGSGNLRIILVVLVSALVGCDKSTTKHPTSAQTDQPIQTGTAVIRGVVRLSGKPPAMALIENQPCHPGGPLQDESVVCDAAGHLQNVVVYLEGAPPAPPASPPPIVLDQVNCRYVPHVLALRTGQTLRVTSSDPTLHNVHGLCTVNDAFNFALVAAGEHKDIAFAQPEAFPVRCDVHPWMKAFIHVFAHPYFAVTSKDGSFAIRNLPAGSYTLVAWQEKYGTLRQPVTVAGQVLAADFRFQSGL